MRIFEFVEKGIAIGIIVIILSLFGPIIVVIFCSQLLWMRYRTPSYELTVKDLCDDVLRTVRCVSYRQDVDARWISESDIIAQIARTYSSKILTQNCIMTIRSIIQHWVNSGILDTKVVQVEGSPQLMYAVVEEKVKELY